MLYPINIKMEKKTKCERLRKYLINIAKDLKSSIKYLIFNRKHLSRKILAKLHI